MKRHPELLEWGRHMNQGIVQVKSEVVQLQQITRFTVIGDPGCDGLGAAAMSIFARALNAAPGDLTMIVGDLVPYGSPELYTNICKLINAAASTPVYTLCGNHDTTHFEQYFGNSDYALCDDRTMILVLNDSQRRFSPETLEFAKRTLAAATQPDIMVMFHIPPPNQIVANGLQNAQWQEFRDVYMPYRDRIRFFVCGHIHSFFTDSIDGIPLLVTGGGGARIEAHKNITNEIHHHVLCFEHDHDFGWTFRYQSLDEVIYDRELADPQLRKNLIHAFQNECIAGFRYHFYAEEAEAEQRPDLAKLFRALATSEYYHARNLFCVLGRSLPLHDAINDSLEKEHEEVSVMYRSFLCQAEEAGHGLAEYAFSDAREAEKVHLRLLTDAKLEETLPVFYHVCTSCGYTFANSAEDGPNPRKCPVCGAPADKISLTP